MTFKSKLRWVGGKLSWLGIIVGIAVFLYAFFGYKQESYYDDK